MSTELTPIETVVPTVQAVQIDHACAATPEAIGNGMQVTFPKINDFVTKHAVQVAGPPRAIYTEYGPDGTRFTVAIPIDSSDVEVDAGESVYIDEIEGGKALRFTHSGSYQNLPQTYQGINNWLKEKGWVESEQDLPKFYPMWEEYVNNPASTPEDELVTYVYVPLK